MYPSWFGRSKREEVMSELAGRTANKMFVSVLDIAVVSEGSDWRGDYVDFNVTYAGNGDE
jgi:hypothetical protein